MTKQTLRAILLGAALSAMSISGYTRAADDTPAAKPATPATQPANGRFNRDPAEFIKNYRDQFEGINLTDDQMKKIDGFLDTASAAVKAAGTDRDASRSALRKLREDTQGILTDTQKTALRAKETARFFDGIKTRYTGADLKLTDDQTAKINAIIDDAKKTAATAAPAADPQQGGRQRFQGMRDTMDKLNAVLTPEQQKLLPQFGNRGNRGNRGAGAGGNANPPATPPATPAK